MKQLLAVLLIISTTLMLAACANKKPPPQRAVYFNTYITPDGSKFFVYYVEKRAAQRPSARSGEQGRPRGERQPRKESARTQDSRRGNPPDNAQRIDQLIADNGYCREGYNVLERYSNDSGTSLRGECKDGATAEDRNRFLNPV